ncbi:hypothetical protein ACKFKF_20070 [Phormidesmis sp. 146-12]
MQENFIYVVTDDSSELAPLEGQRGWREEVQQRVAGLKEVKLNVTELEKKMAAFLQVVGRLFQQAEQQALTEQSSEKISGMQLAEVELSVEISGEGEIKLVAGGKATGKGAIKMKFTRIASE